MSGRNILGVIVTGGVIAGIGYMMVPRRQKGFSMKAARSLFTRRNMNRWGRMMKSALRLVPIMR